MVIPQPPPVKQQAPSVGGGLQPLGGQVELAPRKLPPIALQKVWLPTKQKPLGMQQAPVIGGPLQVVLEQVEFAPCHVPPLAVHWAWVAITHSAAPAAPRQQAPVGAGGGLQSVMLQGVLGKKFPPMEAHWAAVD